jgi:exopolyphosphatase/guanosine-5'-triphosphate,3'-diphosphate pyrophosphatase
MESTANNSLTTAAIDLGSNSFRLLIVEAPADLTRVVSKKLETVRLGKDLSVSGEISTETFNRGLQVISSFKNELTRHNVKRCRCCGTEALRQATNAGVFIEKAAAILGIKAEIIDGNEEAVLGCMGVVAGLGKNSALPLLIIDVGGGSTEIAYLETLSSIPRTISIKLGAVSYSETSGSGGTGALLAQLAAELKAFLTEKGINPTTTTIIGSGGTATALAALDLDLDRYDADKVQGHRLDLGRISNIAANITRMTVAERNSLPGLEQGRGDIILGGIEIYQEILATIEVEGMIISDYGLLEGILLS